MSIAAAASSTTFETRLAAGPKIAAMRTSGYADDSARWRQRARYGTILTSSPHRHAKNAFCDQIAPRCIPVPTCILMAPRLTQLLGAILSDLTDTFRQRTLLASCKRRASAS